MKILHGACTLHADNEGYKPTKNMSCLLLFHSKSGYLKATRYYVILRYTYIGCLVQFCCRNSCLKTPLFCFTWNYIGSHVGNFPCRRRIPVVTMVWVISRFRIKAAPGTSSPYISPLTPSGQRNCASWASQPQSRLHFRQSQEGGPRMFV
jgi:hypothetical protein